jgi:hypothetical protein
MGAAYRAAQRHTGRPFASDRRCTARWRRSRSFDGTHSIRGLHVDALRTPAKMPTALARPRTCADLPMGLVLASRPSSTSAPTLVPMATRCPAGAQFPAISCLGAFRPPALGVREEPAAENLHRCGHERLGRVDSLRNHPFEAYPTGGGARAALQTQKCEL